MKEHLFFSIFLAFILALTSCSYAPRTSVIIGKSFQPSSAAQSVKIQNLNEKRVSHSATLLPNGRVVLIGGMENGEIFFDDAEIFNPETNIFSLVRGKMNTPRAGHTATLLPDGKILVAGGWSKTDLAEDSAEIYDPQADTFAQTGSMNHRRAGHMAVRLDNGKVLIVGGVQEDKESQSEAEVYDPASKTFAPAGKMSEPRSEITATALPDGRVLVTGGGGGKALPSAEIFQPLAETAAEGADQTTSFRENPRDGGMLVFGGAAYLLVR